jgi:uroporphyrinogen decarboxylase
MQEWNSFSRINAVFNHEIPDRVPKYEGSIEIPEINLGPSGQDTCSGLLFFTPEILRMVHRFPFILKILKGLLRHPQMLMPFIKYIPRNVSKVQRKFNYDLFSTVPGVPMVFTENIFKDFYTEEKDKVIRGPGGFLVWRTSPDGAHTRNGFIRSSSEWDKYMEFNYDHPGNWTFTYETIKECKKLDIVPQFAVFGAVAFEELCQIFGFPTFFRLLIKEKAFVKRIVKEMNDFAINIAEKTLERGGKYFYITNDIGFKGRSIISPKMFREFFKPGLKKFCHRVHKYGGKVMMHSCGYVSELIPDFIEAGIDGLHPIERQAGNDIVEIKKKYGKSLVLVGNVPIHLLTHGTPKENYEYVKFLLKNVSKDGGHIISSSHSVTMWCKLKNFLAYTKAVEDFGIYPIKI